MNDMIHVFFDYNIDDLQETLKIEKEIQYLDELLEEHGWKYSGMMNVYVPIVRETRD